MSALSNATTIGGGIINNLIGMARENNAREENYRLNEKAAENADKRTRALYEDYYSPQALMKAYTDIGLSPSFMYGQGGAGAGGATPNGAQAEGASGVSSSPYYVNPLTDAQINLLNAQTKKTNEEAEVVASKAHADIAVALSQAGYNDASKAYTEAKTAGQNFLNYITDNTRESSIKRIMAEAEEAEYKAKSALEKLEQDKVQTHIAKETAEDVVANTRLQVDALVQKILESRSLVELQDAQRKQIKESIEIAWKHIDIEEWVANIQDKRTTAFIEKQLPLIEKELDIRLKELKLQEKDFIKKCVLDSFKALCEGAQTVAAYKSLGEGSDLSPQPSQVLKPKGMTTDYNGVPKGIQWDY